MAGPNQGEQILQRNQPPGVPPLPLTGERTLPDVPEENYWFQRHLVVYRWVAPQVAGKRVVDMGSGEGYGAALLARQAREVVGVEANPEAHAHACARYKQPNLRFARELIESYREPADAIVCLQTIEHLRDPEATLAHFSKLAPLLFISTPNVLTLAPPGATRSDNPFHLREYQPAEFEALCRGSYREVALFGLYHARKLALHDLALRLGWDRLHRALRITKPFYNRFTPAITTADFKLRPGPGHRHSRALDLIAVCRR